MARETLQEKVKLKLDQLDRITKKLEIWYISMNGNGVRKIFESFEIQNKIDEILGR